MNISRENLGDLDLCIKIEIAENDYAEKVTKQLKEYQRKATVNGFRKGMAPMGLIQRMYKPAITGEVVQELLSESLYQYIKDENLDIVGTPLSNDEKTGEIDFAKGTDFAFYFDAALTPELNISWGKVDAKLYSIELSDKDVDAYTETLQDRFGKFDTPEVVGQGCHVYGKVVELDGDGKENEEGLSAFVTFPLDEIKDADVAGLFYGKKAEDKVVFNPAKVFTPSQLEKNFHLDSDAAQAFKSDVEFTVSGCSRITRAEVNEDFFNEVFPGEGIKDAEAFHKALSAHMEEGNNEQCQILYTNQVRKQLIDNFDAPIPESFLKRWILSRGDKDVTAESIEQEWSTKYMPSLKWEFLDGALNKIKALEPTQDDIVAVVKGMLHKNDLANEGEDDNTVEERINKTAISIAQNRKAVQRIVDELYNKNVFALFQEQLKPEVEKVSSEEFGKLARAND